MGAKFRAQGREPATGLDCVGVAAHATGRAGPEVWPLRFSDVEAVRAAFAEAGLREVFEAGPGTVALVDVGARHLHLVVLVDGGHVHACARARRVVETPGPPAGRIVAMWGA